MTARRREALILVAAGLAAAGAGFLVGPLLLQLGEGDVASRPLFASAFPDLSGKPRRLAEWQGRVMLVHFWATWCVPCREEIPLLMAARQKYGPAGVEIVGIAIDNAGKVGEFTKTLPISYPVLLAEAEGLDLMRQLGNSSGGLPYTVVADRQGGLVHRKLGAFKQGDLDAILGPLTRA
ncbi:MAG: TlpA family protein disulfide reductase [Dongiaceae bacterium]